MNERRKNIKYVLQNINAKLYFLLFKFLFFINFCKGIYEFASTSGNNRNLYCN